MQFPGISAFGSPVTVDAFIPEELRQKLGTRLRLLRLFLPVDIDGRLSRWGDASAPGSQLSGSTGWTDFATTDDGSGIGSPGGIVDSVTAAGLTTCLGDLELTGAWWQGYEEPAHGPVWEESDEYTTGTFVPARLRAGERLPEFCWDEAWGSHVYPDSFVVATDVDRALALHIDASLETTSLRAGEPFAVSIAD